MRHPYEAVDLTAAPVTAPPPGIPSPARICARLATMRVHLLQTEAALNHTRDTYRADASEPRDAALGRLAVASGEDLLWDTLTAPAPR
ncbi:hypothetical protein [Streptomyces fractus]|uniref:hypothetical protein n=1 Tax=Streptomyces fractus TaxID=641806 RepID=UPI003CFAC4AB